MFSNTVLRYINKMINNLSDTKNTLLEMELTITAPSKEIQNLKREVELFLDKSKIFITTKSITNHLKEETVLFVFQIKKEDKKKITSFVDSLFNKDIKKMELKKIREIKTFELEDEL